MIKAARRAGVEVIWDLVHYGYPDHVDPMKPVFVTAFARFSNAFAEMWSQEFEAAPLVVPINEISFWSWAGATVAYMNPLKKRRGSHLKKILVQAAIEGMEAIWDVLPLTRFIHAEPLINIVAHPNRPQDRRHARERTSSQYEAWDMLAGRLQPELGGNPKYLDIIGVNYYSTNQWFYRDGRKIKPGHSLFKPLREMLKEVCERYGRPCFIAETGIEDEERPGWFRYICDEAIAAAEGTPVGGVCLYPILNHPGWVDDRHCRNGLWDYADDEGNRSIYQPLADEIREQQRRIGERNGDASGVAA